MLNHIFERAWPGFPADHAPSWAAWIIRDRAFWPIAIEAQLFMLAAILLP